MEIEVDLLLLVTFVLGFALGFAAAASIPSYPTRVIRGLADIVHANQALIADLNRRVRRHRYRLVAELNDIEDGENVPGFDRVGRVDVRADVPAVGFPVFARAG